MRNAKLIAILGLVVLLGSAFGCSPTPINSSSAGVAVSVGGPGTPTTVQVTLLPTSIANGGSSTVNATVKDSTGAGVPNVTVTFTAISAIAGSFALPSATTDAAGVATTTFTAASPAGDDQAVTIVASVIVPTGTINGSAQLVIGNPPRIPSSVIVSLGTTTIANGGNTTVTATVSDALGLISGTTVTFSLSIPSTGNFTAAAPTNAFGQTTVTFTANTPAGDNMNVNITATAGAVSNSAKLTIGVPLPPTPTSSSIIINPLSINIQSQTIVSVTVLGASGPAFNTPVTLNITSGATLASFSSGTLMSSITVTTNASGIASAPIYAGTSSGVVTVTASVTGIPTVQASLFITSDPASISLNVANSNLTNGQTTNITATVLNVLNNPVTDGTQVSFTITSLPPVAGSLSAASASTIGGKAQVTFTADSTRTGGVIIQASVGSLAPVQTIIIVNSAQAGSLQYMSVVPASGVIALNGGSALLTFEVLDINGKPLSGQTVNFQLAISPIGASLNPPSGSTVNGIVTTTLTPGSVAGPVRVIANTTVQGTSTVLYASSGPLSIGGGVPSMRFYSISLGKRNVPGLACDGVTDTVNVKMADRFGNYNILQGTAVSFTDHYGAIDTSNITDAQGQTSSVWRSQTPQPSDGYVAILVQTTGEENFTDLDADGVYTAGTDSFNTALDPAGDDLPEPFIDENHNNLQDTGEVFFDWPSSVPGAVAGTYNTGNVQWDGNIPIFKNVFICSTGGPSFPNTYIACCDPGVNPFCLPGAAVQTSIAIPSGTSTMCYVFGADVNNNPLTGGTTVSFASNKSDATITWSYGFTTYPDSPCGGPAITGFTVTNNNASVTTDEIATLSATVSWTSGVCGGVITTFPYLGAVTLSHL
jgi:hypothetical protein